MNISINYANYADSEPIKHGGSMPTDRLFVVKPPPQKRGLYAVALSFCLPVRLFVCLSPETRTTGGGGGLAHRPFGPN